jgi:hypothetical protein
MPDGEMLLAHKESFDIGRDMRFQPGLKLKVNEPGTGEGLGEGDGAGEGDGVGVDAIVK